MNPLTRGSVILVGKYHHKEGCCILRCVDQMRKRLLCVAVSADALGEPEVGGQDGHNGMQQGHILHAVTGSCYINKTMEVI